MRIILSGLAVNTLNWLTVCIVGLGAAAAAFGGMAGKYSKQQGMPSEEITRRVA
jgi:hypothetical protein